MTMNELELMQELAQPAQTKILMLIMDGLGGLPLTPQGPTELEAAHTPNLDRLASESVCGLSAPVGAGITPGSGPGHLALFGYDPLRFVIGRGVLEALGIGFPLGDDDVAARGNFCTVDASGNITDRRAGRIPTEKCRELVELLRQIRLPSVEIHLEAVQDYRFVLVLRAPNLSAHLSETDPQRLGVPPLPVHPLSDDAKDTADLVNRWVAEARKLLADQHPANAVTLRGFAKDPALPTMQQIYGLNCTAIATYPMYRGLAKLVGMDILKTGDTVEDEVETLTANWAKYDFFYFHVKKTDSAGEDGDFDRKRQIIEHVDELVPAMMALKPDVVIVSGDHSTPAVLKSHSWHPVPTLIWSRYCRPDDVDTFGEKACARGGLGVFPAKEIMPLAMANALRLAKYGA
jgi:2,3-bisphosphoglycerate-independent phosphoglycerate mutase